MAGLDFERYQIALLSGEVMPACSCSMCASAPEASDTSTGSATGGQQAGEFAGEAPINTMVFDTNTNDADQDVDALMNNWIGGNQSTYWNTGLTFSFTDAASDYSYSPGGVTFANAFSDTQKTVTRAVLDGFAKVSNLTFTELANGSADGTLRFAEGNNISTAFAYYPSSSEAGGDAWFNTTSYDSPILGTYAYHTFVHEIGHALGLKHGHETDGPGAMTVARDSMEYSVMTYRSFSGQSLTGLPFYVNDTNSYAQSLMMYDIAAIQRFYGADFTTNSTNSVYTFSTTTGEMFINGVGQGTPGGNKIFRTVWDGDGIDTYDLSNYTTALRIDLTPGSFSDFAFGSNAQRAELNFGIASNGAGGYVYGSQYEVWAQGHLYNALQYNGDARSLIENAIGGSASDRLIGNAAANVLTGNGGNDTLDGGGGSDTLNGGTGTDSMTGGAGDDTYFADTFLDVIVEYSGEGVDTIISSSNFLLSLTPNVENLTLAMGAGNLGAVGNAENNIITGNDGANGITGEIGNDTIFGNGGDDSIDGGVGADSMVGGTGVDTYFVDNVGDQVVETEVGAALYDTVWSSIANYTLPDNVEIYIAQPNAGSINGTGNDLITLMLGNEGNNVLNSLGGNDIILGGAGNDTLNSGPGGDPAGYEVISGGLGADSMTGGGGHDYFIYEFIDEGGDIITDFATLSGADDDILDLRPMFFPTFTNTGSIGTVAQAVASGHLTYQQSGADVLVFADADGGGNNNILLATLLNQTAANVQTYTLI